MNLRADHAYGKKVTDIRKTVRHPSRKPNFIESLEPRTLLSGGADLSLSISGPASVTAGTNASYTLTVVNNGKSAATGVSLAPPGGYPTGATQVSLDLTSGLGTTLASGKTDVYTLVLAVDPAVASGTMLDVSMNVTSRTKDSNPANNTASTSTAVTTSADLSLVVTGPSSITAGTNTTFNFLAFNAGPSTETTIIHAAPAGFPAGVTQVSYTLSSGSGFPLAPGQMDIYSLVLAIAPTVANGKVIAFPAQLNGGTPDPDRSNNSAPIAATIVSQVVQPVNITLTSSEPTAKQGDPVTISALFTPATPGVTPTGAVTFTDNGAILGMAYLQSDGTATLPAMTALSVGDHTIIARYGGDMNYGAATQALAQVITAVTPSQLVPTLGKVTLPSAAVAGAKLNASLPISITNSGSKYSGTVTVSLFADDGTSFDGKQIILPPAQSKKLTLLAGKYAAFALKLKSLPASVPNGEYHILAQVRDAAGLTNVIATTQTITVSPPEVTLAPTTGPLLPASIAFNKPGAITVTVTNNGNIDAKGPLVITIAPSADGINAVTGITLATLTKSTTIKAGKSAKFTIHFKRTAAMPTGTFFPFVSVSLAGVTATVAGTMSFMLP